VRRLTTLVCIDGYNLYYSVLKGGPYKWLDLRALMERLLVDAYPDTKAEIQGVRFFTAPVRQKFASDPHSKTRQDHYHSALKFAPSGPTEVITGYHAVERKKARIIDASVPFDGFAQVEVIEEKRTDVNLGLQLYRDAVVT